MDWSALADAGLYDAEAPDAASRRAELELLAKLGVTVDEMVDARESGGDLLLLATERIVLGGRRTLRAADVAAAVGLGEDLVRRVWRTTGFPDPGDRAVFTEADLEVFRGFAAGSDVFGEEAVQHFARVVGAATERIAEAAVALFNATVAVPLEARGASDGEQARTSATASAAFEDAIEVVPPLLRHHFLRAGERSNLSRLPGAADAARLAVGFCDLSESTALGHRLGPRELTRALLALESAATEVIVARQGRVVKLIGDGVMFVTPVPTAAVDAALALVRFVEADPVLTRLRAGIAFGEVVPRDGDVFGPTVSLAARIADVAGPGEVLVQSSLADRVHQSAGLRFSAPVVHDLRGFDEPVRVRTAARTTRGS